MKTKTCLIAFAVMAFITTGFGAYAHGPGGISGGSSMMGGAYAMMGGHGRGMTGFGQGILNFFRNYFSESNKSEPNNYHDTEKLREKIGEKRRELSLLYRSQKPDKILIDQKIEELNRLESDLDKKTGAFGFDR